MAIEKIMGTETEVGITARDPSGFDPVGSSIFLINRVPLARPVKAMWDYAAENPLLDARGFEVTGERERPSQQDNRAINKVLTNGGRLYVDGAHPEYSTPECTTARDVVIWEKAGERLFDLCRQHANRQLPPQGELLLYKNNSDGKGNSYGYHENYLVSRRIRTRKDVTDNFEKLYLPLTAFLVSRIVMCGSGKVGGENGTEGVEYQISQRADFFETWIGLDTMAKRPIINTRDEPHADEEKYRRFHVIVGDANMAELSTFLKVGTTAIVLAMIEDGFLDEDFLALEDPVRAIKEISHDPTCRRRVRLKRGREYTAVELQRAYLEKALEYHSGRETPPPVADVLERWGRALEGLADDPMGLNRELDWVIKQDLIQSYVRKKGCRMADHRVSLLDLQYHDLRRDKGLYYKLEREGYVERIVTDAEVERAMKDPPPDTRAYFRGTCLQKFGDQIYGASWSSVIFDTGEVAVKKIPMAEPGRGTRKLVGEILERSETVAELLERLAG